MVVRDNLLELEVDKVLRIKRAFLLLWFCYRRVGAFEIPVRSTTGNTGAEKSIGQEAVALFWGSSG